LRILFGSWLCLCRKRFVKDQGNIRKGCGKDLRISRSLPGTVSELSRNLYEGNTNLPPGIPEEK
ncbi:MAG TPA: hypothetical protein PLN99_06375, partial [Daejeonella sp.]|nr:hypothetical protein [Daejeonella sp.]